MSSLINLCFKLLPRKSFAFKSVRMSLFGVICERIIVMIEFTNVYQFVIADLTP